MTESSSTYALLSAEAFFRELALNLSQKEINLILKEDQAFYKRILMPFCEAIVNQHILDHCNMLEEYCQQEVQHIHDAYRDYCKRNDLRPEGSDPVVIGISEFREKLGSLIFRKTKLDADQKQAVEMMIEEVKKLLEAWSELQAQIAEELTQALQDNAYPLSEDFQKKLREKLTTQSLAQIDFPPEMLKTLKIKKRNPTLLEKTLMTTLYEDSNHG